MHNLPPRLSEKIWELIDSVETSQKDRQRLYDGFANILVRSNRIMRMQLGELIDSFRRHAESGEFSHQAQIAAITAIEAARFIGEEIIKPAVSPKMEDKIEDIIQRFWESENEDRNESQEED